MTKFISLLVAISLTLCVGCTATSRKESKEAGGVDLLKGVQHLYQSTIRIQSDKVVYFDPLNIEGTPKDADVVFVTHTHSDHFSMADIKNVMKKDTVVVITQDAADVLAAEEMTNVITVLPGNSYEVDGLKFKTTAAYNTNKNFHKKENNWVGYIVDINNTTYYVAGDTDVIPEMKDIKADVAFLPVGGTYTMTASEAVEVANLIKPAVAVPIHFADIVGTWDDAKEFSKSLSKDIKCVILKENKDK